MPKYKQSSIIYASVTLIAGGIQPLTNHPIHQHRKGFCSQGKLAPDAISRLRPRKGSLLQLLFNTQSPLPSKYRILSRVRRRLQKAKSAPLLTSSLSAEPTSAESPSNPFRMSQVSTATNTLRLPEKLNIPGPIPSLAEPRPPTPPDRHWPPAGEPRIPFPRRCSQISQPHPPLSLPTNADDPPSGRHLLALPGYLPSLLQPIHQRRISHPGKSCKLRSRHPAAIKLSKQSLALLRWRTTRPASSIFKISDPGSITVIDPSYDVYDPIR